LGGSIKLISAGLAFLMLWRSTRWSVITYLTETVRHFLTCYLIFQVLELCLITWGLVFLIMLWSIDAGKTKWKIQSGTKGQWFSSANLNNEVKKLASAIPSMTPSSLIGISFMFLVLLALFLIIQIIATYRFIKYVQDKEGFLVKRLSSKPIILQVPP